MIGVKMSTYGYVQVQCNNATAMQVALQKYGPLAVAITVVNPFYSYSYEIISFFCIVAEIPE